MNECMNERTKERRPTDGSKREPIGGSKHATGKTGIVTKQRERFRDLEHDKISVVVSHRCNYYSSRDYFNNLMSVNSTFERKS